MAVKVNGNAHSDAINDNTGSCGDGRNGGGRDDQCGCLGDFYSRISSCDSLL